MSPAPGSVTAPSSNVAEPGDIDVPAGGHDDDPLAVADGNRARQHGRQGRRAGRLQHLLHALQREAQPGQDGRIVEQHDAVEVALGHGQGQDARERGAEPIGHALGLDADDLAGGHRLRHRHRCVTGSTP